MGSSKTQSQIALDMLLLITKRVSYYVDKNNEVTLLKITFKDDSILMMNELTEHFKRVK